MSGNVVKTELQPHCRTLNFSNKPKHETDILKSVAKNSNQVDS